MLHIRPWEWDLMTVEEADHALDWLDEYIADMEKAEQEMRR